MFDDVLDLARRLEVRADSEWADAADRRVKKYGAKLQQGLVIHGRDGTEPPAWVTAWEPYGGRLPWPVPYLIEHSPTGPHWTDGAGWEWSVQEWTDSGGHRSLFVTHDPNDPEAESWRRRAVLYAPRFLIAVPWEHFTAQEQAVAAVRRVRVIALLELDARLDDELAEFPGTSSSRKRQASESAEQKRAVAGDVNMTLRRIPEGWTEVVFRPSIAAGL